MFKQKIGAAFILFILLLLPGCFRNPHGDADTEFRLLMDNQFSASGSTLAYGTCGWPVSGKMKLKSLKIDLFPDSGLKEGRGYAELTSDGDGFTCGGKLFFIYDYSYTGGHGYSGGTEINIRIINRESAVDENVSNPASAVPIETGKLITGELTTGDTSLPDKSSADYYSLELKGNKPAIKFVNIKGEGFTVKGSVYQDKMHISPLSGMGIKLKPGRAVILISGEGKTGRYSFKIEELGDKEKYELR